MKLIEALKRKKALLEKCDDLRKKVAQHCADQSHETPPYGDRQQAQIKEWMQSHHDSLKELLRLRIAIQRTNLATMVKIELEGQTVEKSIAEWVLRRREMAGLEQLMWMQLTDRNLKEGKIVSSQGQTTEVKIRRYFEPAERDKKVAAYRSEPHLIDAVLETVNALTDLIEETPLAQAA
jgi:hypothetical protein